MGSQTAREALIAELLGDCGNLLDRLDLLKESVPVAVDDALTRLQLAAESVAKRMETEGSNVASAIACERELLAASLRAAHEAGDKLTKAAARATEQNRRASRNSLILGLAGGVVAGLMAGSCIAALVLTSWLPPTG